MPNRFYIRRLVDTFVSFAHVNTLNCLGHIRIEEYPMSFFQDSSESYLELPWLNLLCCLPKNVAKQGQSTSIGYYTILRSIYDKNFDFLLGALAQLKDIFLRAFLLQEGQGHHQYRKDHVRILTLEWLKTLSFQMTVLGFSDHLEGEKSLMELIREVWRPTQMPKQRMTLDAFDDESSIPLEDYQKLTCVIHFWRCSVGQSGAAQAVL